MVSAWPGRTFEGRVESLLPQLDATSRTQQARIVLDNREGLLLPGMLAEVELSPGSGGEFPLVPTDAVIGSGRDARVILQSADGGFRPVAVRIGRSAGGFTEVLAGLEGGERVVASGQFLIDSEASLSGALERLGEAPQAPAGSASTDMRDKSGPHAHAPPPASEDAGRTPARDTPAVDHSEHRPVEPEPESPPPAPHDHAPAPEANREHHHHGEAPR
jgi:Cu(I)/Ag(I) efflux system membrane fusion protein